MSPTHDDEATKGLRVTVQMEQNGISIEDWDARIYRIFNKNRFVEMLKTKSNGLVHPSKWDDPFENFFLKCSAKDKEGRAVSLEPLHRSWFGQCWTTNEDSDAMWRIYSHDQKGVRVGTTIRKLFSSFYKPDDR